MKNELRYCVLKVLREGHTELRSIRMGRTLHLQWRVTNQTTNYALIPSWHTPEFLDTKTPYLVFS